MILFIGNISKVTTESELKTLLSGFASLRRLSIMVDKITRRSRGYAYADIEDHEEALAIINKFNSTAFMGSFLIIGAATAYQQKVLPWK